MKIIVILLIINYNLAYTQKVVAFPFYLNGLIHDKVFDKDSIYFIAGDIDEKYFELPNISSEINNSKFILKGSISYPHFYKIRFKSEENILEWRGGNYFLDKTSNKVIIDSIDNASIINGITSNEYYNNFIPFLLNGNKFKTIEYSIYQNPILFETKLSEYVKINPDSYIALWILIEIFCNEGHSELRQNILSSFSKKLKKEKLWKITHKDFNSSQIKEKKKFPNLQLLDTSLTKVNVKFKNSKYTLVNYWFSTCKPCIEKIPAIIKLYEEYHNKGFEIINISTDQSKYINNWKNKIGFYNLYWPQYLDENGINSKENKITKFPTNYLLNNKFEIIRKDIPINELENLLNQN
ncbi:MAG: TlpA family protein disulfide reductase [Saprospiraceae bacterium]|nr:TlpA family protein disulfide reductase [Saprospiraceae bacterium]